MKDYFIRLYLYNDWANHLVLDLLEKNQVTDEYVLKSFSHIINAQFIWYSRVANNPNNYKVWDIHSLEKMRQSIDKANTLWLDYLESAAPEEFTRVISYNNFAGDAFHSIVQDCITHQVNHATYHRAQIALALRQLGIIPINTDYITYCRQVGKLESGFTG